MRPDLTVLDNVLTEEGLGAIVWQPWAQPGRAGAEIHRLYDIAHRGVEEEAFLVRFGPGAHGDEHQHQGIELMFILTGSLTVGDQGTYGAGALLIEQVDSIHRVSSTHGAVVLCVRHGVAVGLRQAGGLS